MRPSCFHDSEIANIYIYIYIYIWFQAVSRVLAPLDKESRDLREQIVRMDALFSERLRLETQVSVIMHLRLHISSTSIFWIHTVWT
jgi:hypothetical protein